jgi:hypothetical protein
VAVLKRKLTNCYATIDSKIRLALVLNDPATLCQQLVDVLPCTIFRSDRHRFEVAYASRLRVAIIIMMSARNSPGHRLEAIQNGIDMRLLTKVFEALCKEAKFTREMLGSGATQIRNANYASKGIYFQAFTSLSTGLERIGKLCIMLDHYIDHKGDFPDSKYMQREISHNLVSIYGKSAVIISKRGISMKFLQNLNDPIHQAILSVLSKFALGDRYSNIDLLVGGKRQDDPVAAWFIQVDQLLYETRVTQQKKKSIKVNAQAIGAIMSQYAMVLHTSETGKEVTDAEEASRMTGMYQAVSPYRQLYVLQIIRYWVELLRSLQYKAGKRESRYPVFHRDICSFYE